ncbi:MAG: hypothetical protein JWO36_832 [Myxococcales bacterium]|nr:hypothetical protein [Myxococcales bacterium]
MRNVLLIACVLIGCSKKSSSDKAGADMSAPPSATAPAAGTPATGAPAPSTAGDPPIKALRDKMCACKDKACAEAANKDMMDLMNSADAPSPGKTPDEMKMIGDLNIEFAKCQTAAMSK